MKVAVLVNQHTRRWFCASKDWHWELFHICHRIRICVRYCQLVGLVVSGWCFGCHLLFSHILGISSNFIIPIDEVTFFRGVAQPPTRFYFSCLKNWTRQPRDDDPVEVWIFAPCHPGKMSSRAQRERATCASMRDTMTGKWSDVVIRGDLRHESFGISLGMLLNYGSWMFIVDTTLVHGCFHGVCKPTTVHGCEWR